MKEYFKNALIICAETTLLVVCWGLAEFALAVLRIEIGLYRAEANIGPGGTVRFAGAAGAVYRSE